MTMRKKWPWSKEEEEEEPPVSEVPPRSPIEQTDDEKDPDGNDLGLYGNPFYTYVDEVQDFESPDGTEPSGSLPEDPFDACMPDVSDVVLPEGTEPSGSLPVFGWNIFDSLDEGNTVFSPYGIYMALGMLANGAEPGSETESELLKALGASSRDSLNAYLDSILKAVGESYRTSFYSDSLVLVNSSMVFGADINEDYRKRVARYCKGAVVEDDISGDLDGVKDRIRDWVNLKSHGMIPGYDSRIEADTLCDLLNVVYFKGKWDTKFSESMWGEEFRNADGSIDKVVMMNETIPDLHYYHDEKYRAIEVLYLAPATRMCLILPVDPDSVDILSSWRSETPEYREEFVERVRRSRIVKVELFLPKFTMSSSFGLDSILKMLGLEKSLGEDSRFTGVMDGTRLFFGSGRHQAKIKVDEEGTEAVAVTEMWMIGACLPPEEPDKIEFRCDIPFIYVILEGNDNKYLFMGYAGDGGNFTE